MTVELVTTVLTAADSYDLIELETVKDELSLQSSDTSRDNWLNRSIAQVSRSISNFCNRTFQVEQLRDIAYIQQDPYPFLTPGGVVDLQLSRWPVVNLTILKLSSAVAAGDTALHFATAPRAGIVSGPGVALGSTATVSGSTATLSSPATSAMAAGTPIAFGIEVKQTSGGGLTVTERGLSADIDYKVDLQDGQLSRLSPFTAVGTLWEALPTTITYSAGFADVPDDIVVAALRWMVLRWSERSRDPMLRSIDQPLVGTKTYWVGGPPMSGGVPQEIAALLGNYRVPVIS